MKYNSSIINGKLLIVANKEPEFPLLHNHLVGDIKRKDLGYKIVLVCSIRQVAKLGKCIFFTELWKFQNTMKYKSQL